MRLPKKDDLAAMLFEAVAILYELNNDELYDEQLLDRIRDFLERARQIGFV